MNRFFFGNFDFEEQLQGHFQRPAKLERLILEMASCWLAIADAEDHIWCPGELPDQFHDSLSRWNLPPSLFIRDATQIPRGIDFVPWGWSPAAIEFGTQHGLVVNPPPLDIVRLANSREYSVSLEASLTDSPVFATLCRSVDEVLACVQSLPPETKWVIKANWSHAGRERILGQGSQVTSSASAWITQRLARDGIVSWERWLQREAEIGIQWHITPGQAPQLIAVTELLVDPRGQYAGTKAFDQTAPLPDWVQHAADATRPAINDLADKRYVGPVGIDAMRYFDPDSNTSRTRALQDINARWTMGRLAAGWFEKLTRAATWRHGPWPPAEAHKSGSHWISTCPEYLDGTPVTHRTWLE